MTIYRIMVEMPKKGIERTLPYELENMEKAEQTAEMLNIMLEPEYHHHAVSSDSIPTGGTYASHGRKQRNNRP